VSRFLKQKQPLAEKKYAWIAIFFIAIAGLLAWLGFGALAPAEAEFGVQTTSAQWGAGQGNPFAAAGSAPAPTLAPRVMPAAQEAVTIDLGHTSLAGTLPDGQWATDAQGQLRIDFALRQRLDYFLTLLGEQPLDQLRALVLRSAQAELPASAVAQLMQLWDRYVQLQQHAFKTTVDLRQPSGWSAALLERQAVRSSVLGADVAYAFYAQEERELQSMLARVNDGTRGPPEQSLPTLAKLPDAPQREAQLQREWQEWEQRIEAARAQVQRLQTAPELSVVQRKSAVQQVLVSQFSEGSERLRAASLLGL
jgi:lipase chaperone LimK